MNQNKLQVSGQFLYSFTVVAKHMSFTKAAEDLCITQSAVSHRIRCLEQELGFPLFHRLTRKIILTEEGKTLYGALDASLKQIHETIRNIQEAELQGDLVIACAPSIAGCWLLPLLPGSLATVFATVTYFLLVFPCIAGGAYIIATTSVSQFMAALERLGAPRSFSITLAVTLRFLPALRQDFRHIRDAMALREIHGLEEKLECIYVPMLMGAAQTAEELSESATARGIEHPGKMSSWRPIGFHIQDVTVVLLFLALCLGGICCKGVLP